MKRIISLILVLVLASMANGDQKLTVNGQDVNSITLCAGQSCIFEVASDDNAEYANFIGFDDCNSLGDLIPAGVGPAAGACPHISEVNEPYFCGYHVVADCFPSPGIHFAFKYTAQEIGQTDLKLCNMIPEELDSIHITIVPCEKEPAFTYQGWLIDSNGPACGKYDFEFKLYNAPEASDQQGDTVIKDDVDVADGIFTVVLDFNDPCAFNGEARWLEIAVRPGSSNNPGDFVTLSPRQEITPTPYAIYAQTAGSDNDWMVDGNNMYSIPSGNVGIGTTNPCMKLYVTEASDSDVAVGINARGGNSRHAMLYFLTKDSDGNINGGAIGSYGANNGLSLVGDTGWLTDPDMFIATGGNIGIGTTSPGRKLQVVGGANLQDFLVVGADVTPAQLLHVEGNGYFKGNVGIGTTNPDTKLEVAREDGMAAIQISNAAGTARLNMIPQNYGVHIEVPDVSKYLIFNPSGGNVGIGTTGPSERLEVVGSVYAHGPTGGHGRVVMRLDGYNQFEWYPGSTGLDLYDRTAGAYRLTVLNNGNVGIGVTNPTERLEVNGDIVATNIINANTALLRNPPIEGGIAVVIDPVSGILKKVPSSKRYKTNIQSLETDSHAVLQLQPVRFQWKTTGQEDIGLIAEDVEEVLKDLVIYDSEGRPEAVKYDRVALYLLSVVKELDAKNRSLEQRVEDLERAMQQRELLTAEKEVQR